MFGFISFGSGDFLLLGMWFFECSLGISTLFKSFFDLFLLSYSILFLCDDFVLSVHESFDYTEFVLKWMMGMEMEVLVSMSFLSVYK